MQTTVTRTIPGASAASLFAELETLDGYPAWMRLVHRVDPLDPDRADPLDPDRADPLDPDRGRPAWWVELRARIGPFTRSKQLRMVRTAHEPGRFVRFERVEADERDHAAWVLTATVADATTGAEMTMHLEYSGDLWNRAVLGRILDDEVQRATVALDRLLGAAS